eukprot:GGOE01053177.1.p1 GENE.GGOE01053177.1~~GGOE01053177.1.p1  ORF type:complete len:746 (+),score=248.14 GGOE01053177.1:78-2315(+)
MDKGDDGEPRRNHGLEWPLHPFQVAAWVLLLFFPIMFGVFTGPFLRSPHSYIWITLYPIAYVATVITDILAVKSDPVDPASLVKLTPEQMMEEPPADQNPCYYCKAFVLQRSMQVDSVVIPCAILAVAAVGCYVVYTATRSRPVPRGIRLPLKPAAAPEDASKPLLTILFGSQTGTADTFSRALATEGKTIGFRTKVTDLLDYEVDNLPNEKMVIFVVATYGEGEPTDGARDFFDWFREQTAETCDLSGVKFTIFGLGDTQYKHFNQCGKDTERLLRLCGATEVYRRGEGDADKTIEDDFEDWKADLWPALTTLYGISYSATDNFDFERTTFLQYDESKPVCEPFPYNKRLETNQKNPVWATVTANRELLQDPRERSTRHIELSIEGLDLQYEAGDHLGVFGHNPDEVVEQYLSIIPDASDAVFLLKPLKPTINAQTLPGKCTLRQALQWYVDLTYPAKKSVLKALSQFTEDEAERAHFRSFLRNDPESKAEFKKLSEKLRNTYGWLRKFRSTKVPADAFLEFMPRLQPRFYSIASDSRLHPKAIHICVAVEEGGVCTPFLQQQPVGSKVPIFVRRSTFHFPRAPTTPMVLIGPGTGIAPLIGLLQRREALRQAGEPLGQCHFFFGCRRRTEDFLYEEYLRRCESDGLITSLHLAFSRETDRKVYVQHVLAEQGPMVWQCLQNGGRIYVCGDARGMAHDVEDVLKQVLQTHGGELLQTTKAVEDHLALLEKKDRYLKDVWSSSMA